MKQEHCDGQMWSKTEGKSTVILGLTPDFFRKFETIWHIMEVGKPIAKEKLPVLSIITNDDLFSLRSPATGKITFFNEQARHAPDRLTADDDILKINTAITSVPEPKEIAAIYDEFRVNLQALRQAPRQGVIDPGWIQQRPLGAFRIENNQIVQNNAEPAPVAPVNAPQRRPDPDEIEFIRGKLKPIHVNCSLTQLTRCVREAHSWHITNHRSASARYCRNFLERFEGTL